MQCDLWRADRGGSPRLEEMEAETSTMLLFPIHLKHVLWRPHQQEESPKNEVCGAVRSEALYMEVACGCCLARLWCPAHETTLAAARQVKGSLASPGMSLEHGATSVEELSQSEHHAESVCPSLLVPCHIQVDQSLKMNSTS
jgi:hypothetical protein